MNACLRISAFFLLSVYHTSAFAQWATGSRDSLTIDTIRDETVATSLLVDDGGSLHAVWQRDNLIGGWQILYASRAPMGPWSIPRSPVDSTTPAFQPEMAVHSASGKLGFVYTVITALSDEVFVTVDSLGSSTVTRVTSDTSQDYSPFIAFEDNGALHLTWIGQNNFGDWKIVYATDRSGSWSTQLLALSDLGPFGSGAEPFLVVSSSGVAHIFYRGGDFGSYHIHYATNSVPGGTTWAFDIITTMNANDFTARAVLDSGGMLHLLASGNDGFGFPPVAYYLTKPSGGSWSAPIRANEGGPGWGNSLVVDRFGKAHITWDEISGNFYTGNLYYASNVSGTWASSPVVADGATYGGVIALEPDGWGNVIAYVGNTFETQEIVALRSLTPLTSVATPTNQDIANYRLYYNYPNPFNPSTTIRYEIGVQGHVHLTVYDLLGREVAMLVDRMQMPGSYSIDFVANGLASGTYYYQLNINGFTQVRRMVLVQ